MAFLEEQRWHRSRDTDQGRLPSSKHEGMLMCARARVRLCGTERDDTVHGAEHSCRQEDEQPRTHICKQAADEALILTPWSALFTVLFSGLFFFLEHGLG